MKPRINMFVIVDTKAHADTIISNVRSELSGKNVFQEHNLGYTINENNNAELNFDVRFNDGIDRDDIKNWIVEQVRDHPVVKNWILYARVSWHNCTHDDSIVRPCRETDYMEYIK